MHLTNSVTKGNEHKARRLCEQLFPIGIPSNPTFSRVDRGLGETAPCHKHTSGGIRNEHFSASGWRIVHEERMHPYHVQTVESLSTYDYPRQADSVLWMQGTKNNDLRFTALVLFSDEEKFSRESIFNMRNQQVWSDSNLPLHYPL
ncbi:hypothetical protein TNCV_3592671 [Trichonephila clavipes]|nr:hypothetical protein TNCV_3592671 [Trichonephila clavipes]